jgi:diguanylate cyclase (GGDEF)-like protein
VLDLANVIHAQITEGDLLAHVRNQCFAVLLAEGSTTNATALAESIRIAVAEHIWTFEHHSVATTCVVGIASFEDAQTTADDVLIRADAAIHRALGHGGNRVEVTASMSALTSCVGDDGHIRLNPF